MLETPTAKPALDLREKGAPRDGERQALDKRLFMQLQAFGNCRDSRPLVQALEKAGVEAVLYEELNDPAGAAVLVMSEDPGFFVTKARALFNAPPFAGLTPKPEFSMFGRTYALGHEPNLEDWLLQRPRRNVLNQDNAWALWYPLRRTGEFSRLSREEQGQILREHGAIGHAFGEAGFASDIRLACAGLDKSDNDFVIGVIGRELYPLSALVQAMRATRQTSTYIQNLGPFFVGRAAWRSK